MEATFMKDLDGFTGTGKLWRLSEPMRMNPDDEDNNQTCDYVITSATEAMFTGPETYVFPANEDGKIIDYTELAGSFRGGLDHLAAIGGLLQDVNGRK